MAAYLNSSSGLSKSRGKRTMPVCPGDCDKNLNRMQFNFTSPLTNFEAFPGLIILSNTAINPGSRGGTQVVTTVTIPAAFLADTWSSGSCLNYRTGELRDDAPGDPKARFSLIFELCCGFLLILRRPRV